MPSLVYNGSNWSSVDIAPSSSLQSVSCPLASFCAAVDPTDVYYSGPGASTTVFSLSAAKVTYGDEQIEHLSVKVSPESPGTTPTGNVTIRHSTTTLCTITLSLGKGSCTLSPRKLEAGTYFLVARYGGSINLRASTSVEEVPLEVAKATSTTSLKLSVSKVTYGDEEVEHLSITVHPEYGANSTPTGSVTIRHSTTVVCTIVLSLGKGSCTLSARRLPAGSYFLVARYGGSINFQASTSVKITVVVEVGPGSFNLA